MVNESVYGDEDSLVKVRVINVSPVDSGEDTENTSVEGKNSDRPVTSGPATSGHRKTSVKDDSEEDDDNREPLLDNEIHRSDDIDTNKVTLLILEIQLVSINCNN